MSAEEQPGKIVIAGGTGYLGRVLTAYFAAQSRPVVVLSRSKHADTSTARFVQWDGKMLGPWSRELENAEAVVNLSGRSVNCRYNARNMQEIYDSRLRPTQIIGQAVVLCANPPKVWLNASSATIYRHALDYPMDDINGEVGEGFSVDVCQKWEKALFDVPLRATRKVAMRTSIVFGPNGDAFRVFHRLVRFGLGGKMGSGDQFMSWIHEEDYAGAVDWLIQTAKLQGPVNVTAPNPLPNKEFMSIFRQVCHRPGLPAAEWMLKLGAVFLRTESELILKSRRAVPSKLLSYGFEFKFRKWREALEDIVQSKTRV